VYSTVPIDASAAWRGWRRSSVSSRRRAVRRCWYSPAISSRRRSHRAFKGARMIAALNAAGLDLATLGNHEFDFGDDLPIERTREAKWQWVISKRRRHADRQANRRRALVKWSVFVESGPTDQPRSHESTKLANVSSCLRGGQRQY